MVKKIEAPPLKAPANVKGKPKAQATGPNKVGRPVGRPKAIKEVKKGVVGSSKASKQAAPMQKVKANAKSDLAPVQKMKANAKSNPAPKQKVLAAAIKK